MKKVIVFGAAGGTGIEIVQQALEKGYAVTALVRNPAMHRNNIRRLVCISAGGLDVNPEAGFFVRLLTRYVLQRILKEPYADLRKMEAIVQQSNTNYTIVRPARLLDKPATGKYRIGIRNNIKNPFCIARADVAHFIVNHLDDQATFTSTVSISY